MKNAFLTLCAVLIFFLILGQTVVLSQEPELQDVSVTPDIKEEVTSEEQDSFDSVYQSYQESLEVYEQAHDEYEFKKAQYLRFGTLTSRQEAQSGTVKMLTARDNVVVVYLTTLKERLSVAIGIPQEAEDNLKVKIDQEVGWFTDHRDTIPSAGTLEDLKKDSDEARSRWQKLDPLIYEVLATVAHGRILEFTDRTEEVFARLKVKVEEIRIEENEEYSFSDQKFDVLSRWIFETENRIVRSKERRADAEKAITQLRRVGNISSYNNTITILGEAQLYLKEANTYMGEIIREIKTAE